MTQLIHQSSKELLARLEQESPGVLQHNLSLVIGTHVVKSLFIGQNKGPVGLFKFSALIKTISNASNNGNIFAENFLAQLDNRIGKARKEIKAMLKLLEANEVHAKAIVFNKPENTKPLIVRLQFSSYYAYLAAFMLAECDELIQVMVRQAEIGFVDRGELSEMIRFIRRKIRKILSMPMQCYQKNLLSK